MISNLTKKDYKKIINSPEIPFTIEIGNIKGLIVVHPIKLYSSGYNIDGSPAGNDIIRNGFEIRFTFKEPNYPLKLVGKDKIYIDSIEYYLGYWEHTPSGLLLVFHSYNLYDEISVDSLDI